MNSNNIQRWLQQPATMAYEPIRIVSDAIWKCCTTPFNIYREFMVPEKLCVKRIIIGENVFSLHRYISQLFALWSLVAFLCVLEEFFLQHVRSAPPTGNAYVAPGRICSSTHMHIHILGAHKLLLSLFFHNISDI